MKNVLIISSSPRKNGNSQMLCEAFKKGVEESGNFAKLILSLIHIFTFSSSISFDAQYTRILI